VGTDELVQLREHRTLTATGAARVQHLVVWELDDHDVVKRILARRSSYDQTAGQLQQHAHRLEGAILLLGVLLTFLSLLDADLDASGAVHDVLHWVLVVLPVFVAALIAIVGMTATGKRWILVRAASEAIKREVFVWRTRTGAYAAGPLAATEQLVNQVAAIEAKLTGSAAGSNTVFVPVDDEFVGVSDDDDGISELDPDGYLRLRVDDQLHYFQHKVAKLAPQLRRYQLAWILAGGAGSILAAAGASVWIGLSVAIGGAIGAHLKQTQLDTTVVGYTHAIAALQLEETRWLAVPDAGGDLDARAARFAQLVGNVERALEAEQASWTKQMQLGLETPFPAREDVQKDAAAMTPPGTAADAPDNGATTARLVAIGEAGPDAGAPSTPAPSAPPPPTATPAPKATPASVATPAPASTPDGG
jgi:hypothetical protein